MVWYGVDVPALSPSPTQVLPGLDLAATARRMRVAPMVRMSPTPDGLGVTIRTAAPSMWVSTADACAMLGGMDREVLYELGRRGEIEGQQPNKPPDLVRARVATNHRWQWLAASVLAYKVECDRAAVQARLF